MKSLISVRFHFTFWLFVSLAFIIPYCGNYYYWTILNGMSHPMPLISLPWFYLANFTAFAALWFHFPKDLRLDKKFRKRLKNYILYLFMWNLIAIQELMLDVIFHQLTVFENKSGMEVQWLMALMIPLFRGLMEWVLPKFFHKALGYKDGWTKLGRN